MVNDARQNIPGYAQEDAAKRGRLKIFFGACAGVGKTYAMLSEARRQRFGEGLDVVIGVVETHGRGEVDYLTEAIPQLELQTIHRRGANLKEFDLDAALARKPALILIDELAHSNVPGTRHPKRWQDVEELLAGGIDVYTTLNVQHLESLNDIVANITGIQLRETVPDTVFDSADDIAVIDVPPDEILKRLHEGKIHIAPEARQRAIDHFFKKSNLIALRELALRRAAERVDAQGALYNASQGIKEPTIAERMLVCVGHDALSARVVRHAKRMAARAHTEWTAIYVETSRHYRLDKHAHKNIQRNLRLAEKMGGKTRILKGNDAAEEIIAFARDQNFTRIIVGRPLASKWRQMLTGTLADKLIRGSANIEVTVIPDNSHSRAYAFFLPGMAWQPRNYAYAILAIGLCTAVGLPLRDHIDAVNFGMFFLVGVVAVAARFGLGASLLSAVLGLLAFDFFFTKPYNSLTIYNPGYIVTLFIMMLSSVLVSSLASRLRLQALFFRKRDIETGAFYSLTSELAATSGAEAMAEVACNHIRQLFDCIAVILLPGEKNELIVYPGNLPVQDIKEEAIIRWCLEHKQPTGLGTATMPASPMLCLPLLAADACLGVLSLQPGNNRDHFDIEQLSLLDTFVSLIASAMQRANASHIAEAAKIEAEAEKLRNMLLSSVSHDLRTPLASVRGSIEAVLASSQSALSADATELLQSACKQSERLTRMVNDLLDINRLETGKPLLNRQPYYIDEIIGSALARVKPWLGGRTLKADIAPQLPLVIIDGALIEQVLVNLLENAIKYTPMNGAIRIHAEKRPLHLYISVSDNGCGIPVGEEMKIFEKFYRVTNNPAIQGSGLGLAICKAIIAAHSGLIWAVNKETGGMSIMITLPLNSPEIEAGA